MSQTTEKKRTGWLDFLASLKVTVYTLILLGAATLAGTVLPQKGITLQPDQMAHLLHQPTWRVLDRLGLLDVFHSVWFLMLVALLIVNLITCTWRYLVRTKRQLDATGEILDQAMAAKLPTGEKRKPKLSTDQVADNLTAQLASIGKVIRNEREGNVFLFVQNSPLSRYAVVFIHLSILFVVAGALLRLFFGIEGMLKLPEGGEQNIFTYGNEDIQRLPVDIRCDRFTMEFYEGSNRPKDYRSDLTVLREGKEVSRKTIEVNDPLKVGSFRFFQATYGQQSFPILHIAGNGMDRTLPFIFDEIQSIPGRTEGLRVIDARETEGGLEIRLMVYVGGKPVGAWLKEGGDPAVFGPYQISFVGHKRGYYTGLMVTADPGVNLVWLGSALFFIGLFWSMFANHRRVWARIGHEQLVLTGNSQKRKDQFADWLKQTADLAEKS